MKKRRRLGLPDGLLAIAVVLAVVVLHQMTDAIGTLERRFYDAAVAQSARTPSERIAILAIDDQSIANLGRWPWPRDIHADLIARLSAAKAKTIVHTSFFFEPQTDRGLAHIHKIRDALAADPALAGPGAAALGQLIAQAETALDTDAKLAASIKQAGNVLIPAVFTLGEPQGRADADLPPYVARGAIDERNGFSVPAVRGQYPIEAIGSAAAGVGHLNQLNDVDGAVREDPLLVNYYGKAVPSLALLAAAHSLNLSPADIRLHNSQAVQLGRLRVRTDEAARMLPQFYQGQGARPAFTVDSVYDVLSGKIPAAKYADKIVLIGATAAGVGASFAVPGHPALSSAEMLAHITSSILNEHVLTRPEWTIWAALGALLLVAAYLLAALPRLSAGWGAGATATLFIALLVGEYALLARASVWLPLVFPATALLAGHLALTTRRFLATEAGKLRSDDESAEANRMMGLALQGQGQLDMAFDRFRRVPMSDALMDNLYALALDFERKRQFNKAEAIYDHMARHDRKYRDIATRRERAKNLSDTVILGGTGGHPGGALLLDGGAVEKPMLGRYQLEKELGKGAMGVVYLGKDPKIGRVVAIKTLALSQEFEGEDLANARERFFREAETAGRLAHQNIVTIFDAGEEHDLAYIAMEFLKGADLVEACRPGQLLPARTVLSIVARVAQALAYAHGHNVVHRDIKPANIMYEPQTDAVKVTDFGIARITDASKTRTGMVLGTPSFMSPEQIAGKPVDGRSDLYSLGVMLFQMLTGVLPLRGETLAELMYKIANEEAPDVRTLRPELPEPLARVVATALAKKPEARYQDGERMAADLRDCLGLDLDALAASAAPGAPIPRSYDATLTLDAQASQGVPTVGLAQGAGGLPPQSTAPGQGGA